MTAEAIFAALDEAVRHAAPEERARLVVQLAARLAQLGAGLTAPPSAVPEDRLLDMPEVARILAIPEDRAYDLGRQHAFPVVTIGKYRRVRHSALAAFIAASEDESLDREAYGTYSAPRDRRRSETHPKGPRAHAGAVGGAGWRGREQRRALGARGDGHSLDGGTTAAIAGAKGKE